MSTSASRTKAQASYHPSGYGTSPSLQRARRPFLVRNIATGGALVAFTIGVYWYSIHAVKQDDFADIQDLLPPASERAGLKTIEEEESEKKALQKTSTYDRLASTSSSSPIITSASGPTTAITDIQNKTGAVFESIKQAADSAVSASASSAPKAGSLEEQFAMFRLPFFHGRSEKKSGSGIINGNVDVDRLGSIWDDGVGGSKRLV